MILRCPHCRSVHLVTRQARDSICNAANCGGWMDILTEPADINAALKEAGKLIAERLEART